MRTVLMLAKGQIKIQEMAFMLVALVFFFIVVGLFVVVVFTGTIREEANVVAESEAATLVSVVAALPEFRCARNRDQCVDADKLQALVGKEQYALLFPFSSIEVIRASAFTISSQEYRACTRENYPECDVFTVYDTGVHNEQVVGSYVALCRTVREFSYTYERCELARLVVGVEIQ